MQKETLRLFGVGTSMMIVGGALGIGAYFLLKKKLEAKYDLIAQEEIAKAKKFYSVLNKEGKLSSPKTVLEETETVETIISVNTYRPEDEVPAFDLDEEEKNRTEEEPYVISHDEYMEGSKDYSQNTFTYFEGDDVLTDENDDPIIETDAVVGDQNLTKFGYGSRDNNIVYIRNDILQLDFEVIRRKGNYAKEVLGFVEHSEPRGKPRKFRRDYE